MPADVIAEVQFQYDDLMRDSGRDPVWVVSTRRLDGMALTP
jgi:hypothetical protein